MYEHDDEEPAPNSPELMFFWPEDQWNDPWEVVAS